VKKGLILTIFSILFIGVGGLVYWGQWKERTFELYYSGTIEATQSNLAFQINGRVREVLVDEGQSVQKDQLLAALNKEEFEAQRDQSQANLTRSIETMKQLEKIFEVNQKSLPAEVERAEASVKIYQSQLADLESGYRHQEIEQARLAVQQARIAMEEAQKDKIRFDNLFQRKIVAEKDKDAANLKYVTALKEYERAEESLKLLQEGFRKESIETARARLDEARAALKQARSNLKRIEASAQDVKAAKAAIASASATLEMSKIQLAYTELKAPFDGILISRNVEPGEVVSPGREVLSLSDLSEVDLKVFVDETEIGKVKPAQKVEVKTDTFPDRVYTGTVSFISPEAEFTPKIIQTHKERVKLVYLVKIAIPNPDLDLKIGMPADAWFR
jgi:HlyD family secretion protein